MLTQRLTIIRDGVSVTRAIAVGAPIVEIVVVHWGCSDVQMQSNGLVRPAEEPAVREHLRTDSLHGYLTKLFEVRRLFSFE